MKPKREFTGHRIEQRLLKRVKRLAELQKRSPRQIMEFALERGLPALEAESGIKPSENSNIAQ